MKRLLIFIGIFFLTSSAFAQLNITFPTSRAVFQRDKSNAADIYITGTFLSKQVDRIEARLSSVVAGQGIDTGWQVIQNNPQGGTFLGKIRGQGGWYLLEVRTVIGSNIIETSSVNKVGIGEVFVIAGQSNAQGKYKNDGEKGANDDRVSCVNAFNGDDGSKNPNIFIPAPLTSLSFSHLDQSNNIAPMGLGAWCWGELGDLLTARLNVPVMFFNAALQNTSALNWYETAQGLSTKIGIETFQNFPYVSLKNTINFYVSVLGIRAILWHQGETDNSSQTSTANYAAYLQGLINISRKDANKNISWVISRATLTNYVSTWAPVIAAQNQVLATPNNNVFEGPLTDGLQLPRPDGVHFRNVSAGNAGLTLLANAWDSYLTTNFFQNSTPFSGSAPLQTQFACNGTSVTLSLPNTYASYSWTNGSTTSSISPSSTDNTAYSALVKDNSNNFLVAAPIIPSSLFPAVPAITAKSATQFCADKSVTLAVNSSLSNLIWTTGETSSTITIKNTGTFSLKTTNNLGCTSQSNVIATTAFPLPFTPSINISNSPANSCEGSIIVLTSSNQSSNITRTIWTTPAADSSGSGIAISKIGSYTINVRVRDNLGCYSPLSATTKVSIRANPPTPAITVNGSLSSCDGTTTTLSAPSNYRAIWTTGDTTRNISFARVGDYSVSLRVQDDIGCASQVSLPTKFSIHALPSKPTISVNGPLSLCEGSDIVILTAAGALKTFWNTPTLDSTRSISFSKSGDYNVAARVKDNFNCYSSYSSPVKVSIRPVPLTPEIVQTGTYTLQATSKEALNNDIFEWKKDNSILSEKTSQEIKTTQQGYYSVTDLRVYSLDNNLKLTCRSKASGLVSYIPDLFIDNVSIYPNPNTTGIFTVESKDDLKDVLVSVFTVKGQLVTTSSIALLNTRKIIDVSNLDNGNYILRLQSGTFKASKKIVIFK